MDTIIYYSEIEGISLEHLKRPSGFDMRSNHFHNEYEIYFLLEGERLFFFNNRAYHVKKINKYITTKRITISKSLLSQGYSVNEACEACGFNDYSNYLKAFTKAVGISPKKYAQFNS